MSSWIRRREGSVTLLTLTRPPINALRFPAPTGSSSSRWIWEGCGGPSLEGWQVVVAVNLAPARIRGVESQGMLLGVGCEEAKAVALLTVNRRVSNGAPVA